MDNAPYHKVKDTDPVREMYFKGRTISTALKQQLLDYLTDLGVNLPTKKLKSELLQLAKSYYGQPPLKINAIAQSYGHEVLFTPPYWPEFQPIEEIWGLIKNFVANNRHDFSMREAMQLVILGHQCITPQVWNRTINNIQKYEDNFSWANVAPNFDTIEANDFEEPDKIIDIDDSSSESSDEEFEF